MRRLLLALLCLALVACDDDDPVASTGAEAIIAADRSGHFFDRPYPSDELLTPSLDLSDYPRAGPELGQRFIGGWARQADAMLRGFSALEPVILRFRGNPGLAPSYDSSPGSPARLVSLDSGHAVPLRTKFIGDPGGDPYLDSNIAFFIPEETSPLRSGERYVFSLTSESATAPAGYVLPPEAPADAAIATVFTVQDMVDEMRQILEAADAAIDANPDWLQPEPLREVASLRMTQGLTPSGNDATIQEAAFLDGSTEIVYLDPVDGAPAQFFDLTVGPMTVYQTSIMAPMLQDPAGRPYQSTGAGIVTDYTRSDGWIALDESGQLTANVTPEAMRVTLHVPRAGGDHGVLLWAHGSGGDAYESVARKNPPHNLGQVRQALANAGTVIVGSDTNLFGARFPIVEEGYNSDIYVNIGNLGAFRDLLRQGAVEQWALHRFATEVLPGVLGTGVVNPAHVGMFGHSIGAQVDLIAGPMMGNRGPERLLLSGAGGFIGDYIVSSDLLDLAGNEIADLLFVIAGVEPPDPITPEAALAALFGIPVDAAQNIDRHHPLFIPLRSMLNGADPLALAPHQPKPARFHMGLGDRRVPEAGTRWTAAAMPLGVLTECVPGSDYDGHYCVLRESSAVDIFVEHMENIRQGR